MEGLFNNFIKLFIAGVFFYTFLDFMFSLSFITGIGFIISCFLAFHRGVVFKEPGIIGFIAIGYVLTNTAVSQVLPMVYEETISGTVLTGLIIFSVFLTLYLKGKEIQS